MISAISEQKFCKDCANLIGKRDHIEKWEDWKCGAEQNKSGVNLVSGATVYKITLCDSQRKDDIAGTCGPNGKWFIEYQRPIYHPALPIVEETAPGAFKPVPINDRIANIKSKRTRLSNEDLSNL